PGSFCAAATKNPLPPRRRQGASLCVCPETETGIIQAHSTGSVGRMRDSGRGYRNDSPNCALERRARLILRAFGFRVILKTTGLRIENSRSKMVCFQGTSPPYSGGVFRMGSEIRGWVKAADRTHIRHGGHGDATRPPTR